MEMEIEMRTPSDEEIKACLNVFRRMLTGDRLSSQESTDIFWQVYSITASDERGFEMFINHLRGVLTDHAALAVAAILSLEDDHDVLILYARKWGFFTRFSDYIADFGLLEDEADLDFAAKPFTTNRWAIDKMMLETWRLTVLENVNHRLLRALMNQVNAERSGETADYGVVVYVMETYVWLCTDEMDRYRIYKDYFESAYIEALTNYYKDRAKQFLADHGVHAFIIYAKQKILDEYNLAKRRTSTYESLAKVVSCCNDMFVTEFSVQIASECQRLLATNEEEKLQLMYEIAKRSSKCREFVARDLQEHIFNTGIARLRHHKEEILRDCSKYVAILLRLANETTNWFENDAVLVIAADNAFKLLVNDASVFTSHLEPTRNERAECLTGSVRRAILPKPDEKSSERFATYCDMLLRKTTVSIRLSVAKVKDKLQKVMKLIRYLNKTEAFIEAYTIYLARRLICETSMDMGLEHSTAAGLEAMGMPGMSKINHMFGNIQVSREIEEMFKASLHSENEMSMAEIFAAKVIHPTTWKQTTAAIPVCLPAELEAPIPRFKEFYTSMNPGRKLHLSYAMTRAVININSSAGTFELEVTAYQVAVLCTWNDQVEERQSFYSLRLATLLQASELRKVLWSLVASDKVQHQVLCYSPAVQNGDDFDNSSTFWLNTNFAPMMNDKPLKGRISLAGSLQLAPQKPDAEDQNAILQLRNSHVQEAILKSIETKESICHAELLTMVAQLLKPIFRPTKELITEQAEWMVQHNIIRKQDGLYESIANNC